MITYKNKKIKTEWESRYEEIREREGCDSRGTGTYRENSYKIFKVGRNKFESLEDAKRYIASLYNKKEIKRYINKYNNMLRKRNRLNKDMDWIYKYIDTLGYDVHLLRWHREG